MNEDSREKNSHLHISTPSSSLNLEVSGVTSDLEGPVALEWAQARAMVST